MAGPGLGGCDPLPPARAAQVQSLGWGATQLRTLLHHADLAPPYVLVTSSIGSWIADQYTAQWPRDAADLVLIDPTNCTPWPQILENTDQIVDGDDNRGCARAQVLGRMPDLPPPVRDFLATRLAPVPRPDVD